MQCNVLQVKVNPLKVISCPLTLNWSDPSSLSLYKFFCPFCWESSRSSWPWCSALHHCISYWFHSTASASWLNQVLPFLTKNIPLHHSAASCLWEFIDQSRGAVRACWCSQGGSSTCPRSSGNIQAQGCLKVVQQCRETLNLAMPEMKIQVKTSWIQGKIGRKDRSRVGIENSKERGAGFSCQHENWWQLLLRGCISVLSGDQLDTQTLSSCLPWFPDFSRAGTCTSLTTKLTPSTMLNKTWNCSAALRPRMSLSYCTWPRVLWGLSLGFKT